MAVSLPRVPLAALPTPLTRASRLETALGSPPLYVKRDDLSGFAFGGTKVRALEYLVGDACTRGCDVLVVGGGAASSFAPAAAAAARVVGLDCVAVLYGHPGTGHVNLSLLEKLNADVRYTGAEARDSVDAAIPRVSEELVQEGRVPYAIPRGGATALGAVGSAFAVAELAGQVGRAGFEPSLVLVATGSGGTHAGLLAGASADARKWPVVGASVSRPPDETVERVGPLARECAESVGLPLPAREEVHVRDVRGPGFPKPSKEGAAMAELALVREGLLLDHTYTAKALAALPELLAEGVDGPVVFWHTGGTASVCEGLVSSRVAKVTEVCQ